MFNIPVTAVYFVYIKVCFYIKCLHGVDYLQKWCYFCILSSIEALVDTRLQ